MTGSTQPPFQVLDRERPFHGHVVDVRVDRIASADGRTGTREVVEHPGAVAALVIDQEGAVLLVDQWRHAIGGRLVEVPAGKYDVSGEQVEDALRRELAEELRVESGTLTWLTTFYSPEPDWEEAGMEVVRLSYEEALTLASTRPPGDSKTLVALGLYGLWRAGVWSPDPSGRPAPDAPRRRAARRPPTHERSSGQRPPVP